MACQGHWLADNPPPDLSAAFALDDPAETLRVALRAFYDRYGRTHQMTENLQRDRGVVEALDRRLRETMDVALDGLADELAARFSPRGRPGKALRAAVALALDFWTWRRLSREGLGDRAAADLITELVRSVAAGR